MTLDSPRIQRHGDGYRLVFEEVYATDIDDLWSAVTQPDRLARWMADYTGDLRLGGQWRVADGDGEGGWGRGAVTACEPPHRFTTVWHAEGEDATELTVRLAPVAGGTRLILEHTGIRSSSYGAGWQTYLEGLAAHVADPGADGLRGDRWARRYGELAPAHAERFRRA